MPEFRPLSSAFSTSDRSSSTESSKKKDLPRKAVDSLFIEKGRAESDSRGRIRNCFRCKEDR